MISILLDNDIAGHRGLFNGTIRATGWDEFQLVRFVTMEEAGIASDAADADLWRFCQQRELLLNSESKSG